MWMKRDDDDEFAQFGKDEKDVKLQHRREGTRRINPQVADDEWDDCAHLCEVVRVADDECLGGVEARVGVQDQRQRTAETLSLGLGRLQ